MDFGKLAKDILIGVAPLVIELFSDIFNVKYDDKNNKDSKQLKKYPVLITSAGYFFIKLKHLKLPS